MATAEERRERVMAYLKGKEAEDEEVYEGGSFEWDSDDGPSSWPILAPFCAPLPAARLLFSPCLLVPRCTCSPPLTRAALRSGDAHAGRRADRAHPAGGA
eukprot:COSAG04_NODE_9083_length_900_cov_2.008739_1_plen_99_part_10